MRERIQIRPYQGNNSYGEIYGDPVPVCAYVEPGFRRVTNANGEERIASALLMLPAGTVVKAEDLVTWQERHYVVIDDQPMRPKGSTTHIEVMLQSKAVTLP